jgi:hypothetical protein
MHRAFFFRDLLEGTHLVDRERNDIKMDHRKKGCEDVR